LKARFGQTERRGFPYASLSPSDQSQYCDLIYPPPIPVMSSLTADAKSPRFANEKSCEAGQAPKGIVARKTTRLFACGEGVDGVIHYVYREADESYVMHPEE
jgi:hypothetical protein